MAAIKFDKGESWKTGSSLRRQRMELFLQWYLTPASERHPQGRQEFAEHIGVGLSTLWRYEQDRWFQDELVSRRRGLFKVIDIEAVLKNLVTIASDPQNKQAVSAARTLLEWADKAGPVEQGINLTELSIEELYELAQEAYAAATVESVAVESGIDLSAVDERSEVLL